MFSFGAVFPRIRILGAQFTPTGIFFLFSFLMLYWPERSTVYEGNMYLLDQESRYLGSSSGSATC